MAQNNNRNKQQFTEQISKLKTDNTKLKRELTKYQHECSKLKQYHAQFEQNLTKQKAKQAITNKKLQQEFIERKQAMDLLNGLKGRLQILTERKFVAPANSCVAT